MDKGNKIKILESLLFFYLILFPFGQIIRWQLNFGSISFALHPTDFIAVMILVCTIAFKLPKPKAFGFIQNFLLVASFSLLMSIFIFKFWSILVGAFYLLRIYAYAYLFVAVWNIVRVSKLKETLLTSLIGVSGAIGIFGWFQYFFYPDIRPLIEWGWDDHLFRLVSTFLDPSFTSIILVFGYILCLSKFLFDKKRIYLILALFFLVTVAFTYSRAGYLAIVAGSLAVLWVLKKARKIFIPILTLLLLIILLPRGAGEGVKLTRIKSIYARSTNYVQTIRIIGKAPLFGVGFNNLCLARQKYLSDVDFMSHSCSGSDSSILFILVTTGIIGLIIFAWGVYYTVKLLPIDLYGVSCLGVLAALGIHGFFSNSYFYPWVMGYLAILYPLTTKKNS